MSFYEQSPGVRLKTANYSEVHFDEVFGDESARWGIDHPPFDVSSLPPIVRYAPDRIMAGKFVECKGIGKDAVLKIKVEQMHDLRFWSYLMPVKVFIWDSHRKRWTMIDLETLEKAFHKNGSLEQFPDNNKPAWFMSVNFLDAEWTDGS